MTEIYKQEPLPGLTRREILETMTQPQIVEYIVHLGKRGEELEAEMDLAADVLEKEFGVTVSEAFEVVFSANDEDTQSFSLADLQAMLEEDQNGESS